MKIKIVMATIKTIIIMMKITIKMTNKKDN